MQQLLPFLALCVVWMVLSALPLFVILHFVFKYW